MEAEFTVTPVNLHRLISDPEHVVPITGTVRCQALSGSTTPMPVQHGCLRLLPSDPQHVETWNMVYTMFLCGQNDTLYYVEGYKIIHQRPGSSVWSDLTTLYVTVYVCPQDDQGEAPPAATHRRMVGRGIITLGLDDPVRQGSTLKLHRGVILSALRKKLRKWCLWKWWDVQAVRAYFHQVEQQVNLLFAATFAGFFGQVLFRAYGGLLADLADFPRQDNLLRPHRGIKAPKPEIHRISTTDQVELQLTRYAGKHPVLLAPGFGVRASSFATDTTNENLVEYLLKHDYDVWLFDYRASPTLTSSVPPFTIDDIAQYDWPAAVQYVCGVTRTPQLQAIAHCVGSMSFLMALLLNRDEFRQHIRSAICSQLTLHPVTNWLNHLKADINLIGILEKGFGLTDFDLNSASPDTPGYMTAKRIDTALWNVPVPAGEACTNPTCHRISSVYGPVYAHRQLNAMTHTALSDMFGPVHLKPFEQLSRIVKQGVVVDHKGRNIYLTVENARHLRLPLTFMAGGRNQLFYPETSELTLAWLKHVNPGDKAYYTRHVFAEYAHMDVFIGKSADREVFPFLIKTLHDTRM
jgi:cholesterol oxidase